METNEAVEEMLANAVQVTAESSVEETEALSGAVFCRLSQSQVDGFAWI
jgi:hypothetical protein